MRHVSIASAAKILGTLIIIGFVAVVGFSFSALSELKVGGPVYQRIVLGKDLVADILPPPEYIIEAYLETTLLVDDPTSLEPRRQRLEQLLKDYNDRHAFWLLQTLEPELRDGLTRKAHDPAERFWQLLKRELLPAIEKGDSKAVEISYAAMSEAYAQHRAAIDQVVIDTNRINAETEAQAASTDHAFVAALWAVSGGVLLLVIAGIAGTLRGLVRPMTQMTAAMNQVAAGDLSTSIPMVGRQDELGAMADAMQVFRDQLQRTRQMEAEAEAHAERVAAEQKAAMHAIADSFEKSVKGVVESVANAATEMQGSAQSMSAVSEQASRQSTAAAAASEQASINVQTVASAAEELSSSVAEIGHQVEQASKISIQAVDQARHNREIVEGLAQAASKIGAVINLITDIASQTNLLALNATIEAARAGEAGKGFAVVANEVKHLANQTARATDEISQQINGVQGATQEAVQAIESISATISRISEISATIAAAVEEQGAATHEIARNVEQAASGTRQVSSNIIGVTQAAGEAGQAANEVLGAATGLSRQAENLSSEVDAFIARIRVA